MSVNIDVELDVTDLVTAEQARTVEAALEDVFKTHRIDGELPLWVWQDAPDVHGVTARTEHFPLSITGYGQWGPRFEQDVVQAARQAVPTCNVSISMRCPDDDN